VKSFDVKEAGSETKLTLKNIPRKDKYTYVLYRPGLPRGKEVEQGVALVDEKGNADISLPKMEAYFDGNRYFHSSFVYRIAGGGYVSQVYRKNIENVTDDQAFHNF